MTKPQIKQQMEVNLSEFFDGYVLVARVAGSNEVVVMAESQSVETTAKLMCGISGVTLELIKKQFRPTNGAVR